MRRTASDLTWIFVLAGFAVLAAFPVAALARPEFAARQAEMCWKCHVNPFGGGMRNETGAEASKKLGLEAVTSALEEKYPKFAEFDPALNESIRLGADARMLFLQPQKNPDDPAASSSTFYSMQANLYASADLLPIFTALGGYDPSQNTYEAYALIHDLPLGTYFRAGRFFLPYGLRFDDHTVYTRTLLSSGGVNSAMSQDTGVEAGFRPGPFFLSASLTNGALGQQRLDQDKNHYAVTTQGGVKFWKIMLGGGYVTNTENGIMRNVYGPWASFGIGPVALLGEAAVFEQETASGTRPGKTVIRQGSAGVAEADVRIIQGLFAQTRYMHMDKDLRINENYLSRISGGVTFYPMPYFKLQAEYAHNQEPADQEIKNDQFFAQVHIFF